MGAQQMQDGDKRGGLGLGITLGVLVVLGNFFFDGCGNSRVRNYFAHYDGSAGYSHLAIKGLVRSIEEPSPSLWRNLHYGSNLQGQKQVGIEIIESEVPPADVQALFIGSKLQPEVALGKTYCFHVSHVGNYYSFLFRSRYGFEAYSVHDPAAGDPAQLTPQAHWARPYKLYSLCALLLPILFVVAAMRMLSVDDKTAPRGERLRALRGALPALLLYICAAGYIVKLDWVDHIWPIGKPFCLAVLLGLFFWVWLKQPEG